MDSMVRTAMAIEREVDDARNIRDASVVKDKRRESQPSSSLGKEAEDFYSMTVSGIGPWLSRPRLGQGFRSDRAGEMFPLP